MPFDCPPSMLISPAPLSSTSAHSSSRVKREPLALGDPADAEMHELPTGLPRSHVDEHAAGGWGGAARFDQGACGQCGFAAMVHCAPTFQNFNKDLLE